MLKGIRRYLHRSDLAIVGITRFSTLFEENHPFADADQSFEQRATTLFDENRLLQRFAIWEAVTLPSLVAQTDTDFALVIVSSSLLPDWAQDRLYETLSRQPFRSHVVLPTPDLRYSRVVREAVRAAADPYAGRIGTFRLDDDDALASDWVVRFRAEVKSEPDAEVFGFENGWFLCADKGGLRVVVRSRKLIACGLARVSPRAPLRTIHSVRAAHHQLDRLLPTRHCGGAPAWIVTAHSLNDSERILDEALVNAPRMSIEEAEQMLGERFNTLDLNAIAAILE